MDEYEMSDKLDWLNEHFVLLKYQTLQEVVDNVKYKIPFEFKELAQSKPKSEEYLKHLFSIEDFAHAAEFMAYNIHPRSLSWWGYCCSLSLREELRKNPPKQDLFSEEDSEEDQGHPLGMEMPKVDEEISAEEPDFSKLDEKIAQMQQQAQELISLLPSGVWDEYLQMKEQFYGIAKKELGKDPREMLNEAIAQAKEFMKEELESGDTTQESEYIHNLSKELQTRIDKINADTMAQLKAGIKIKSPAEVSKDTQDAMDAAFQEIIAPTPENAKLCLDIGNKCADTPEGLLAMLCFWCYGDLSPEGEMVIKTPPELPATGLYSLLVKSASNPGGTRKIKERMKLYSYIGREICFGVNNWSAFMNQQDAPHNKIDAGAFLGLMSDFPELSAVKNSSQTLDETTQKQQYKRFKG